MFLPYLLVIVIAYLLGAVPVGWLIARSKGIDIRQHGSGKLGTTNVLRTIGRRAAALVLLGDCLKGSIAVLVARGIANNLIVPGARVEWLNSAISVLTLASVLAAIAAVSGHVWSIYMRFLTGAWSGGRGVATAMGATFVIHPLIPIVALAVGIPTIIVSRYVSLGSILGTVSGAVALIGLVLSGQLDAPYLLFITLGVFVIVAHRDNMERILKGTERKIGKRAT